MMLVLTRDVRSQYQDVKVNMEPGILAIIFPRSTPKNALKNYCCLIPIGLERPSEDLGRFHRGFQSGGQWGPKRCYTQCVCSCVTLNYCVQSFSICSCVFWTPMWWAPAEMYKYSPGN